MGLVVLEIFFPFIAEVDDTASDLLSMEDNGTQGVANLDPRGKVGRIYVGDHWTLLYIKYISCVPEL